MWKILFFLQIIYAQWIKIIEDLQIPIISVGPDWDATALGPAYTCPEIQAQYSLYYQTWTRNFNLAPYQPYNKLKFLFDVYNINTQGEMYATFDGVEILRKSISYTYEFQRFCSLSTSTTFNDSYVQMTIEIPITAYAATNTLIIQFPNNKYSLSNFQLFIKRCSIPNCDKCNDDYQCLTCLPSYQISGNNCICSLPLPYLSNGMCVSNCGLGQYPDQMNQCQNYVSKTMIFQKFNDLTFTTTDFVFLPDTYFTQSLKTITSISGINAAGPFQYNEGIQYIMNLPSNLYLISALIYWLGNVSLSSQINLIIDDYYVGKISDFHENFVLPENGIIGKIYNCVHIDFSKCVATRISYTIEAPIGKLLFKGNFNTNTSLEAWAIRDLQIDIITIAPTTPLSCSGATPLMYQNTCVAICPSYSSQIGTNCQDLYSESVFLIKAFDSNDYFYMNSTVGQELYVKDFQSPNYETYLFLWENKNMFGGINFWRGKQFVKQFINLPPHYQIKVIFTVISIDGQPGTEKFNFFFDNIQTTINIDIPQSPVKNIGLKDLEYVKSYANLFAHSSSELQILLECVQSTTIQWNSCALYDYFVIMARCPYNCKVCSDYLSCTEYYPPGQSSCGYGYFYDTKTLQCSKCPRGCLSCTNSHSCDICNPNYTMFGKDCYCTSSKSKIPPESCDNFHKNCLTSTSNTEDSCQTCDSSSHKWLNINQCQCLRGFYMDQDYVCLPCKLTCETCDGQAEKCLSCVTTQFRFLNYGQCDCWTGYFSIGLDETCLKCNDICETCFISPANCATCYPEHNRKLLNNKCYCQNGYYDDGTLFCKACSDTCLTCLTYSKCWSCKPEQFRNLTIIGNKCLCKDSYYEITETSICQPCHPSCKKCNNSADINQCISCPSLREASTLEMDTFQCKCLKGYYESEEDYICLDCLDLLDPPLYHYCYSLCGDGVVQWNEDCDDQNDIARDGCDNCRFSDSACLAKSCNGCRADKCASCTDGYFLGKDSICYICDSSCITCVTTSTNCIECAYPIEGSTQCLICDIGYLMNSGTCDSICGDGLQVGTEECDDGNNKDGDGCSSECKIEPGSVCKSSCEPINYVNLFLTASSSDKLFDGLRHAQLYLDQPVQILGNASDTFAFNIINQSNISISIIDYTDYSQTYFKLDLSIQITFTDSIQSPILQLIVDRQNIKNQAGDTVAKSEYQVQLNDCQFYSAEIQNATEGLMNLSQYILFVMLGLAIVAFLFGGLNIFWNLLDTLQLLSYIKYFNIQYPYNVTFYLTLFGFAEFNFMQDFFDLEAILSQYVDTPDTDQKFLDEGYSSVFYVNCISVITVFLTTLGIYFLCHFIFYLLKQIAKYIISIKINDEEEEGVLFYFLMKITKNLEIYFFMISAEFKSGLLRTFMAVAFDLNIAIFLQLKDFNIHSAILFSSGIVTIIVLIFQIYFVYNGFIIMSKPHYYYKLQQTEFKYGALYEGVKIGKNPFTYYFNLIILVKKMLFMFFLVILYNVPILQIGFVSMLNISILAYVVLTKPLEDYSEYIKLLIGESLIWLIELITLFYAYNEQTNIFDNDQQLLLGWFIIALCSLIIIIQLIIDVKQHASYLMREYAVLRNFFVSLQNLFNQQSTPDEQERLFSKQQERHTIPGSRMKSRSSNKFKKVVTFSVSSSQNS